MRNIRWQLLIAVGGLILVVGLLVGQTPDPEVFSSQPAVGGVYIEALIGEIQRLNPIYDIYNQVDKDIDKILYRGLIRFDERGAPNPDLAEWIVIIMEYSSLDAVMLVVAEINTSLTLRHFKIWIWINLGCQEETFRIGAGYGI